MKNIKQRKEKHVKANSDERVGVYHGDICFYVDERQYDDVQDSFAGGTANANHDDNTDDAYLRPSKC